MNDGSARYNLNNPTLRIVTRLDNNYVYDVEVEKIMAGAESDGFGTSTQTNYSYKLKGGYAASLLIELSNYLNFSYELVMDSSTSSSGFGPGPGLTYSFDKATNLSIDLFAASYSLVEHRALSVDPTFVIGASRVQVFINHRYESFMLELLLVPFQPSVWLCLLLIMSIQMIALGCIAYLREKASVQDAIFQMVSTILHKDSKVTLNSYSASILIWTVAFSTIILYATFSGNMISISTIKKFSIQSLDALVDSKFDIGFDVGQRNDSVLERIAKTLRNRDGVMSKLLKKVRVSNFKFDTFETSMREVEKRPFAYIIDEETGFATIQRTIGHFPCDWDSLSFAGVKYPWSMYMRRESPFRPAINYGIQKMRETGNMRRSLQRWIPTRGFGLGWGKHCPATFTSIELRNVQAAFVLLSSSSIIALFILLLENLQRNKWQITLFFPLKMK